MLSCLQVEALSIGMTRDSSLRSLQLLSNWQIFSSGFMIILGPKTIINLEYEMTVTIRDDSIGTPSGDYFFDVKPCRDSLLSGLSGRLKCADLVRRIENDPDVFLVLSLSLLSLSGWLLTFALTLETCLTFAKIFSDDCLHVRPNRVLQFEVTRIVGMERISYRNMKAILTNGVVSCLLFLIKGDAEDF
ncbi:hypothetical protein Tco_1036937 [Tanacetum coccineum]